MRRCDNDPKPGKVEEYGFIPNPQKPDHGGFLDDIWNACLSILN